MRRARILNRRVIEEEYEDPDDRGRGVTREWYGGLPTLAGREGGRARQLDTRPPPGGGCRNPLPPGDVGDKALLAQIACNHELESCIHFAALAYVGESVV